MGDVFIAAITPEVLVGLIELLRQFSGRTTTEQNDIREDLIALQIDLGIIKDIVKIIMNNNLRNLDGLMAWREEASRLVNDAGTLLQRIKDQNNRPQRWWRNRERFHCSRNDTRQLNELRRRCDNLSKHNETILRLREQYRRPFGWLFCGYCG